MALVVLQPAFRCELHASKRQARKKQTNPTGIVENTNRKTLKFVQFLHERFKALKDARNEIVQREGSLQEFSLGFNLFGLRRLPSHAVEYSEWAPGVKYCALVGDFNGWNAMKNPAYFQQSGRWKLIVEDKLRRGEQPDAHWQEYEYAQEYDLGDQRDGVDRDALSRRISDEFWEPEEDEEYVKQSTLAYPKERVLKKNPHFPYWDHVRKGFRAWERKYSPAIAHASRVRAYFETEEGCLERVPAWATYVLPDIRSAVFWDPPLAEKYQWKHARPGAGRKGLRIYECHIGISGEDKHIATFKEFTGQVLPYVKEAGYNVVQLFGIQEHADYSSVGYKVTHPFAVSSRFGTPEDFKCLVDTAHGLGILVFLDIVHSHFAPDEGLGLSNYDGANDCYCQSGRRRGYHNRWKTRILDYSEHEVKRFLLSNLRWWVEEYRVDGFQFHSIASMLYKHNGFSNFTGDMNEYAEHVDVNAHVYLILANELLHSLDPYVVTIAEDVTLYPGLCAPGDQGGLGFDYYVNALPSDVWLYSIEHVPLEAWNIKQILQSLLDSFKGDEKSLLYVENHSQSISGGRSLFQALMEKNSQLPWEESMLKCTSIFKLIKLLTLWLGGNAYLNFMGNEFGHPGHAEFPREENNFSFEHASRRWKLLQEKWHSELAAFDKVLMAVEEKYSITTRCPPPTMLRVDDSCKVLIFTRENFLFAFNFHANRLYTDCKVTVDEIGRYELVIDTDQPQFGGLGRLRTQDGHPLQRLDITTTEMSLQLPPLSAQVYRLVATWDHVRR